MHIHNCRRFQEHLRMVWQSLRALCKAPRGLGSIWMYLKAVVWATRVAGRFACGFWTDLHVADVANLVTVTKTNTIHEMHFSYGTLRATGVRIRCQVSYRACAQVSAALNVSRRPTQMPMQLHNLTILLINSCRILNAPPSLQHQQQP
jgi:hypothetical protein